MLAVPRGPRSDERELAIAPAIAIDLANAEDRGREQMGDIHALMTMLRDVVGECLRLRVIRKIVRAEGQYEGSIGTIVETTDIDSEIAERGERENNNHWYFGAGVSPAVLVMECHPTHVLPEGTTVFDASGREIPRLSVEAALRESMEALSFEMFFKMSGWPMAALEKTGMSPEEIWKFLEEEYLTHKETMYC